LLQSEKQSLIRFLIIYLTSTIFLFSIASWIFYTSSKKNILEKQQQSLKYEFQNILSTIRNLHQSNDKILYYPDSQEYKSAMFDLDKEYIFGSFDKDISYDYRDKEVLIYKEKVEPYYLGCAYLLLAKDIDYSDIFKLKKMVVFMLFIAILFFSILGYFLGKLFVAPMKGSIEKMNQFIQDTTHELNTPISTILTNIEMLDTFHPELSSIDEFSRIEIASRTLSRIYDDLSYLNLNHKYHREIVSVDMGEFLEQRVLYFQSIAKLKSIDIELKVEESITLEIDKNDAIRLVDNLLSNAIKYNKMAGKVIITLNQYALSVEDSGIGIANSELNLIKKRFHRANSSEGGFGIGLDIVNQVIHYYNFKLEIDSTQNMGTKIKVIW